MTRTEYLEIAGAADPYLGDLLARALNALGMGNEEGACGALRDAADRYGEATVSDHMDELGWLVRWHPTSGLMAAVPWTNGRIDIPAGPWHLGGELRWELRHDRGPVPGGKGRWWVLPRIRYKDDDGEDRIILLAGVDGEDWEALEELSRLIASSSARGEAVSKHATRKRADWRLEWMDEAGDRDMDAADRAREEEAEYRGHVLPLEEAELRRCQ